jgi:Family of unknown function (DUF6194)
MNEAAIISSIVDSFEGVETATANGDTFFFYRSERMFPFATLVMSDFNDSYSNLSRPSVFRLNIGVSKQTYQALFGRPTPQGMRVAPEAVAADSGAAGAARDDSGQSEDIERSYDFTVLDTLMPHPVYGRQYWVCVLSPSQATFEAQVRPLLVEAYELAAGIRTRRARRE